MERARLYSRDYHEARDRFCQAAERAGLSLSSHPITARGPRGEALAIDVAVRTAPGAHASLVISSGTHGIEGFFGSAAQLGFLQGAAGSPAAARVNLVLVHAVNPHGFAHCRRVNEDNVDLNRNFVLQGQAHAGAHPLYAALNGLLNPESVPSRADPFFVYTGLAVARHGFTALKNAIAQGQYDFPRGLFYGGAGPTASARILRALAPGWAEGVSRVLHVDLHTGMGVRGSYALCVDLPSDAPRVARLRRELGARNVQAFDPSGVLYEIRGSLSRYLDHALPAAPYDCLLAEFGTLPSLAVLQALRFDNRVAHYAPDDARLVARAREHMLDAFCPPDLGWRNQVLQAAEDVLARGLRHLSSEQPHTI